jgi:hypothetical protein
LITLNITKLQLKNFLDFLAQQQFGQCNACGELRNLICHHWHDQNDIKLYFTKSKHLRDSSPFPEYSRNICNSCNSWLTRGNNPDKKTLLELFSNEHGYYFINEFEDDGKVFTNKNTPNWIWSHILPPWDIQVAFVLLQKQIYKDNLIKYNLESDYSRKYQMLANDSSEVYSKLKLAVKVQPNESR